MSEASYLYKAKPLKEGYTTIVSPENSELRFIEFGRLYLPEAGDKYADKTRNREVVLTIFNGLCDVEVGGYQKKGDKPILYQNIGGREDVFSGRPTMVYLPRDVEYKVKAKTPGVEIGVSKAPSKNQWPPRLVKPEEVMERTVGAWNWRRRVYTSIGEWVKADMLLVGETVNPPGNWSSSPPHKHDTKTDIEAPYEEVYFFKVKPPQGFGIQRIYTPPSDEEPFDVAYTVENNDTVVIPRGYHPVVAAPGYQLYYLWILAGEERRYGAWSDDPRHKWIKNVEPIIMDITE